MRLHLDYSICINPQNPLGPFSRCLSQQLAQQANLGVPAVASADLNSPTCTVSLSDSDAKSELCSICRYCRQVLLGSAHSLGRLLSTNCVNRWNS